MRMGSVLGYVCDADRGKAFQIAKEGDRRFISQNNYLGSAKLVNLIAKGFGNFSEISASSGLFWRFWAGCVIAHKAKEKPPETCLFPVV